MSNANQSLQESQSRLAQDLKNVAKDTQDVLSQAARVAGQSCHEARDEFKQMEQALLAKAQDAGRATDDFVRRHPWACIGVGAGLSLLLGMLIARK